MANNESWNYETERNDWEELRRTMECFSDHPFRITFIKGEAGREFDYPRSEVTQSDNSLNHDLASSSTLKTANDGSSQEMSDPEKEEPRQKILLRNNRSEQIRSSNITQLNNIFNTDAKKTIELSSRCQDVIKRELTFWFDRVQFEMKQSVEMMENLCARMERIKGLNRELRYLLAYFKDDTDSSTMTTSSC